MANNGVQDGVADRRRLRRSGRSEALRSRPEVQGPLGLREQRLRVRQELRNGCKLHATRGRPHVRSQRQPGPSRSDCCDRAKVGAVSVDKYLVTAGRMRGFLTRHERQVPRVGPQSCLPSKWNQAGPRAPELNRRCAGPTREARTRSSARASASARARRRLHNGHTFWTPARYGDAPDFSRRGPRHQGAQLRAVVAARRPLRVRRRPLPQGERAARRVHEQSPDLVVPVPVGRSWHVHDHRAERVRRAALQLRDAGSASRRRAGRRRLHRFAFYIAPPGRRPKGYNTTGHADLVGNLLEWVGDSERQFVWKGSFEHHAEDADKLDITNRNDPWMAGRLGVMPWHWTDVVAKDPDSENMNGYYAIGGRCGY